MNQLKPLLLKLTLVIACVFLVFSIVKRIKYRDVVETDTDIADAITKLPSENFSVALSSFYFTNLTETQQIGKTISLNESFDNLYYNVNYPVFGIESIDVALKEDINQALSGFFTQFATYDAPNDASRAFLNIDYESYLVGDSIASVV